MAPAWGECRTIADPCVCRRRAPAPATHVRRVLVQKMPGRVRCLWRLRWGHAAPSRIPGASHAFPSLWGPRAARCRPPRAVDSQLRRGGVGGARRRMSQRQRTPRCGAGAEATPRSSRLCLPRRPGAERLLCTPPGSHQGWCGPGWNCGGAAVCFTRPGCGSCVGAAAGVAVGAVLAFACDHAQVSASFADFAGIVC